MIKPVAAVEAMAAYALADLNPDLVSLAQNESAYPCSPKAVVAGEEALKDTYLYSDPDWLELRKAIASAHRLEPQSLLCGAGSMEIIAAIIKTYSQPGDEVLGTAYGYLFVSTACQQAGSVYKQAPEPEYAVDVDLLLANVSEATKIVFVCNPGNPTGTRIPNDELIRLRNTLADDILLVIDQAYAEFDDQDSQATFALVERGDTIVTRTLSKAYALAGQRIGWGVFPGQVAIQVRKLLNPNNVSLVAQAMACAAMNDQEYMRSLVLKTAQTRDSFVNTLRLSGIRVLDSHTNFVLLVLDETEQCQRLDNALREQGFLARGMAGYGLPHCLRLTIGSSEDMKCVASLITEFTSAA